MGLSLGTSGLGNPLGKFQSKSPARRASAQRTMAAKRTRRMLLLSEFDDLQLFQHTNGTRRRLVGSHYQPQGSLISEQRFTVALICHNYVNAPQTGVQFSQAEYHLVTIVGLRENIA